MKIHYIQWRDSRVITCGWQDRESAKGLDLCPCHSVGIIIEKTKHLITLAPNWSEDNVGQVMVIPKSSVTKMECIKEIE